MLKRTRAEVELKKADLPSIASTCDELGSQMKEEGYHDDDYQLRDELSRLRATVAELKLEVPSQTQSLDMPYDDHQLQAERSKKRVEHVAVSRRQSIETLADRQWQRSPGEPLGSLQFAASNGVSRGQSR